MWVATTPGGLTRKSPRPGRSPWRSGPKQQEFFSMVDIAARENAGGHLVAQPREGYASALDLLGAQQALPYRAAEFVLVQCHRRLARCQPIIQKQVGQVIVAGDFLQWRDNIAIVSGQLLFTTYPFSNSIF